MKNSKTIKSILAVILSVAIIALASFSAIAAPTIDAARKGSITLYKYEGSDTTKPLKDVEFTYAPVGSIEQFVAYEYQEGVLTSTNTSIVAYAPTQALKTLINLNATPDYYDNLGNGYYKASTLEDALALIDQATVEAWVEANGTAMPWTAANGKTEATNLDLGIYLIAETQAPTTVVTRTAPFFVSVPFADVEDVTYTFTAADVENNQVTINGDVYTVLYTGGEITSATLNGHNYPVTLADGTYTIDATPTGANIDWVYDVVAYPKNTTSTPEIDKNIIVDDQADADPTNDTTTKAADEEIGDTVPYQIVADVLAPIGNMRTYIITDTLSKGLTYVGNMHVYGVTATGAAVALTENTDYTVTVGEYNETTGTDIEINFTTTSLSDAEGTKIYDQVYVTFDAVLNKDAIIGGTGNPNNVELEYSNTSNVSQEDEQTSKVYPVYIPVVYTYATEVYKFDGATEAALAGVIFELQDAEGNKINVSLNANNNHYYLDDAGTAVITTDATGYAYIDGLDAGTYFLEETSTLTGYALLKDKITVTITSTAGTYVESISGTFLNVPAENTPTYYSFDEEDGYVPFNLDGNTGYVDFAKSKVFTRSGAGTAEEPYVYTAQTMLAPTTLSWEANFAMNDGTVLLNVENNTGFTLPGTGGMGTYLFTFGGIALIVIAAGLYYSLVIKKKKTDTRG